MGLGFLLHPTNMEVVYYLKCKKNNPTFTCAFMGDMDVYKFEPWYLPAQAKFS